MPVTEQTPVNSSTGNGVTTVFPYTFKILAAADMLVQVDGVTKTLTTDYSVSGVGVDGGGNVTFVSAPANGTTVVRARNMAIERTTDYQENGDLPAATLDDDIDRAVMIMQQVNERTDRSIALALGTTGVSTELPVPEADKMLGWNAGETALENKDVQALGVVDVNTLIKRDGSNGMTGALNTARATVTGHATDTPIWAAAGNEVAVTGTPDITDFPDAPQAGASRVLYPAAGTIFRNNANIAVQGAADYTAAAGDIVTIHAITTTTFRAEIEKADGTQVGPTFILSADITPAQITADQNDYNPTGLSTASTLRLSSDASRNITGLAGGADGRVLLLHNVGANAIVLKDESASSTAANRFALSADITLAADQVAVVQYDSTSSRWRAIAFVGGVLETSWTDYSASSTVTGWSSFSTKQIYYKDIGKTRFVQILIDGTSNSTSTSLTLPSASSNTADYRGPIRTDDNSTINIGHFALDKNSSTVNAYYGPSASAWTASGTKRLLGTIIYQLP
jgi:hypothetical protein